MSENSNDLVLARKSMLSSLHVWRCLCVFGAALLIPGLAFAACVNIDVGAATPLAGTPFSACSISGSTVTCNQDVTVTGTGVCVTTSASPLTVNMSGKTLNWEGNNGQLGSSGNPINLVLGMGTINLVANNFTSYGNWSGNKFLCSTNSSTFLYGTLTATSTNTCTQYVLAMPVADWRMDESTPYSGTAGEVKSSVVGGTNGTAFNGTNNGPGKVCRAATFGGINDYISVPLLSSQLSGTASLSFWINTTQIGTNTSWTSPGVTGIEQNGGADDIFWGWINATGKIAVSKGNTLGARSTSSINNGAWRHIVLTRDQSTGVTKAYVDGVLENTASSDTGVVTPVFTSIGRIQNTSGSAVYLIGSLDEVKVFTAVLSNTQVSSIYANESAGKNWDGAARVCSVSGPHHLEIVHANGTGLTCSASTVTVRACADAACAASYTGGVSGTLTATGAPTVNWDGTTGGAAGANFVIPAGSSSVTKNVHVTTVGSVVFGVATPTTPAASNATTCNFGSPACTFTASAAGFIFDVPHHVSEVLQAVNVSAVKTADNSLACVPAFASVTKAVTFKCSYANPVSGTLPVRVNGTALNAASNAASACDASGKAVNLSFGPTGLASTTFQYADVGNMSLAATYTGSGADAGLTMTGSDEFIAAPKDFAFSAITSGLIKAGNSFSATVTARNSANNATPNFGKEAASEGATLSFNKYQPTGASAVNGIFSGSVGAFASGVATSANLQWNEVGTLDLIATLTSGSYLGSGLTVTGSTGTTGAVGRFTPDHFDTVLTQGCAAGGFTYSGQPFTTQVTARSRSGNKTSNYDGSAGTTPNFAKAGTTSDANAVVAGSLAATTVAASAFTAGISSPTPTFTFASPATAPAVIKLRVQDADGVTSATGNDGTSATAVEGTSTIVSGRLNLLNAYGSELLALPLVTRVEYYDVTPSAGWRQATSSYLDTCTNLAAANFAFSTTTSSCVTAASSCLTALSVTSTGSGPGPYHSPLTVSLSKPAAAGSVCVTVNLDGSATGKQCTATGAPGAVATSANAPWLKYPWTSSTATNPTARATFGIYKSPLIYRRENY